MAATARTKPKLPLLIKDSIKKGIEELEEGKGKKFNSSKEFFKHLKSLPKA